MSKSSSVRGDCAHFAPSKMPSGYLICPICGKTFLTESEWKSSMNLVVSKTKKS